MRRLAAVIAAVIALGTLGLPAPLTAQEKKADAEKLIEMLESAGKLAS